MTRATRFILVSLALGLIAVGLTRVRFDVDVLNLLPGEIPEVQGLKLYQQHFANSRELIVTVSSEGTEKTENATRSLAEFLLQQTNLISSVVWQPPWLEHPDQAAALLGFIWLNQPPEIFAQLTNRLAESNLYAMLAAARMQLATSLSPGDIAQLSYDPFGFTKLPESAQSASPSFAQGQELFTSVDGTFRLMFVKAASDLSNYRRATKWLNEIQNAIVDWRIKNPASDLEIHYTGAPAFVAEISGSMEREMTFSIIATAIIIGILFFMAHRRIKPMLWLLALLVVILAGTLAVGGLIFSGINVVSIGFAAILLGLAVDYGVVHYQEALAHPELTIHEVRRRIWPGIFWAAATTISAFFVLNFGGLPGLAQLGSLVALGVALSALTMIFFFLPPLFRDRNRLQLGGRESPQTHYGGHCFSAALPPRSKTIFAVTILVLIFTFVVLVRGIPKIDSNADALRPQHSQAYATMDQIKTNLSQKQEPLWVVVSSKNESQMACRLNELNEVLSRTKSNGIMSGFLLPANLWPQPENQKQNVWAALSLVSRRENFLKAALTNGFSETSVGLANQIFKTWEAAARTPNVFWPSNFASRWIFERFVARTSTNFYAVGFVYPPTNASVKLKDSVARLAAELPHEETWISGWEILGAAAFQRVKSRMWFVLPPMILLVLGSLCLAFRRLREIFLGLASLVLSGLLLLAVMKLAGWNWNLLNLMALPLILGTGVDYGIFMQLALRRHNGNLCAAHHAVGRALLLCGATAATGFGSLAFSNNAGMASLGKVCAVGIANNMLISVYLLPTWWHVFAARKLPALSTFNSLHSTASSLYRVEFWRLGLFAIRILPARLALNLSRSFAEIYSTFARRRRETVIQNFLPALNGNRLAAEKASRELFQNFTAKLLDLWRYESGLPIEHLFSKSSEWEQFGNAHAQKRGVLLVTPHLGNWEFGGPMLTQRGIQLQVITQAEPGEGLTELRRDARSRWNVETLVVGRDPFAFVEVIRRLESGATVALLVDRPPPTVSVAVEFFGRTFNASVIPAELARASGCVILPGFILHTENGYAAKILPPIAYDRPALRDRAARQRLTQEIMRAFEPVIRQNLNQWYQFVPIWPENSNAQPAK